MHRLAWAVLVLFAAVSAAAQQAGIDPSAVPVEREPQHHLVFSNPFVRVIDATLPPLYVSQYHSHEHDNVAVTIQSGRDDAQGQARVGFAGFSRGGYSHVTTNPNTGTMRFIDVELLGADRSEHAEEPLPFHETVLTNARVRVMRVRLAAGQSVGEHRHASGYVRVTVRGGDGAGTFRWVGVADGAASLEAGRQSLEIVEIEPK